MSLSTANLVWYTKMDIAEYTRLIKQLHTPERISLKRFLQKRMQCLE